MAGCHRRKVNEFSYPLLHHGSRFWCAVIAVPAENGKGVLCGVFNQTKKGDSTRCCRGVQSPCVTFRLAESESRIGRYWT